MNFIKILVMSLFLSLLCSCGSTSSNTSSTATTELIPVAKSVVYNNVTPGNSLPDIFYNETIIISGTTMKVTRIGGAKVNSGTWTIDLNQVELTEINNLLSLAESQTVEDYVSDNMIYDGPDSNLLIGDLKAFHYGMVVDPISNKNQWHQFPIEATNLVSNIENLMIAYIGNRYK